MISHESAHPLRAAGIVCALLLAVLVPVVLAIWIAPPEEPPPGLEPLPDFAAIDDTDERKARFIEYVGAIVQQVNGEVRTDRERLLTIARRWNEQGQLNRRDARWLEQLAQRYQLDPERDTEALLGELRKRVDTVPTALAVAQAAKESAWGRSRFAQQGNNLFGEWCFTPGCGIVPGGRSAGAEHEVRRFATVGDSVRGYVHNLNTHSAYSRLRQLRAKARAAGREPTAVELAGGLVRYSERGQVYVDEIRSLIRNNDME